MEWTRSWIVIAQLLSPSFFSAGWTVNNNKINLPPQSQAQAQFILHIAAAVCHFKDHFWAHTDPIWLRNDEKTGPVCLHYVLLLLVHMDTTKMKSKIPFITL